MTVIEKRMARIRAMPRKSRMDGWYGHIPTQYVIEYAALKRLQEGLGG